MAGPGLDFPHATWRRLLGRRLRKLASRDLDYGPPEGSPELRAAVASYLRRSRGVSCTADQVVIVRGSQQALDLVARVLLDPGDHVLLEEPFYPGARGVFVAAGMRVITAPVAADGIDVSGLGAAGQRVRLAYVTPSHQFPTGAIMSVARRLALLGWAEDVEAYVIEDDYDSEYRYAGRPIEALQGLDRSGRVIYIGTFSKLMFPALRLGYVVLPEPLVEALRGREGARRHRRRDARAARARRFHSRGPLRAPHPSIAHRERRPSSGAARGDRAPPRRPRRGVRRQRRAARAALAAASRLPARRASSQRIEAAGVRVYPVTPFYRTPPTRTGFILGYASLTERQITEGVRRLGAALFP